MSSTITRQRFLQLGLASLAMAVGCGDDETSGSTSSGPGSSGAATGGNGTGGTGTGGDAMGGNGMGGDGMGGNGAGGLPGVGGGGGGSSMCAAMIVAQISSNHGHALEIPFADVVAGQPMTYSAQGTAQHCHEVSLDAADFQTLLGGGTVIKRSCNGMTDHEYVLSCAANPPGPQAPACDPTDTDGTCN